METKKIYLVQGDHQAVPNRRMKAFTTKEKADAEALSMVNDIRDWEELPPATSDWQAALKEAQLKRIASQNDDEFPDDIDEDDEDELADEADCCVWIIELALD